MFAHIVLPRGRIGDQMGNVRVRARTKTVLKRLRLRPNYISIENNTAYPPPTHSHALQL